MRINPRNFKVNGQQYAYILDAISPENVGRDSETMSDRDKVALVLETFKAEKGYPQNKLRFPNVVDRLADWLQGLPSVIGVAFTNCDIIQQGKAWGYCETSKQEEKFVENWFHAIASKILQLAAHLDVSIWEL